MDIFFPTSAISHQSNLELKKQKQKTFSMLSARFSSFDFTFCLLAIRMIYINDPSD